MTLEEAAKALNILYPPPQYVIGITDCKLIVYSINESLNSPEVCNMGYFEGYPVIHKHMGNMSALSIG